MPNGTSRRVWCPMLFLAIFGRDAVVDVDVDVYVDVYVAVDRKKSCHGK